MSGKNTPRKPYRRRTAKVPPAPGRLFAQPANDFYALPELEMRGRMLVAQGCRKVLDFTPQKICLDFGRSLVTFYGRGLRIESLIGKRLILTGRLARIEFTAKWGDDTETDADTDTTL